MEHLLFLATLICVWIILSVAANLVVGYTGMMSMGHAGYLGVGAYTAATANIFLGVNYLLTIPLAAVVTAAVAVVTVIPLLRLGTFYFALATLGLNFVLFDIFLNVGPRVEGTEGLFGMVMPAGLETTTARFALTLLLTAACVGIAWRLVTAPLGRVLRSVRDREDALRALGKNPRGYQIAIWGVSGALTGVAGALYAVTLFYIDPTLFTLNTSILVLVYIGVGGLASIAGSILGPLLLIAFTESFRFLGVHSSLAGPIQQGIYGLLLIGLMIYRRQGLIGKYDFRE